jgi:hypothetical protein
MRLSAVLFLLASPSFSQALWEKARFGMTEVELKAAYGVDLERAPDSPNFYRAYVIHRTACAADLQFGFIFLQATGGLQSVSVLPAGGDNNLDACVENSLVSKYGAPSRRFERGSSLREQFTVWLLKNGTKVTMRKMNGTLVQIAYEVIDKTPL